MIDINNLEKLVTDNNCVHEYGVSLGLTTRSTCTLNHTFCNMYIVYTDLTGKSCMYETTRFSENDEFVLTECMYELANHVGVPSLALRLRGIADGFSCIIGGR